MRGGPAAERAPAPACSSPELVARGPPTLRRPRHRAIRPCHTVSATARAYRSRMPGAQITLDEAVEISRTGDLWLFRGDAAADRAVRVFTNAPVNHVGMAVVLDDLPPLMWHAELGRSLPDVWTGTTQRGAQLHDLRDAVTVWSGKYGQEAWLRQLDARISRDMEDALLRSIARLDGTPFPSTAAMAGKWLAARLPRRGADRM